MSFFLRILVLGNALFLALPSGWCCLLPAACPAHTVPQVKETTDCCCCTKEAEKNTPRPATPPHTPTRPCCVQRDLASVPASDVFAEEPGYVGFVGFAIEPLTLSSAGFALDHSSGLHVLSPSLQILHCVWLC